MLISFQTKTSWKTNDPLCQKFKGFEICFCSGTTPTHVRKLHEKASEMGKKRQAAGAPHPSASPQPPARQPRVKVGSFSTGCVPGCQSRRFVALQSHIGFHLRQNVNKIYKQYAMFYTFLSVLSSSRGRLHDQGMH